jgi:hypothetical protein
MSIEILRSFLGWCAIVNYVLLIFWFLVFLLARDRLYKLYDRWFRLSAEEMDRIQFIGMMFYKLGILLFNLAPYLVLRLKG